MMTKERIEGHCKRYQHDCEHQAELEERDADVPEHDDIDSKHGQSADEDHKVQPTQEDQDGHTIAQILLGKKILGLDTSLQPT